MSNPIGLDRWRVSGVAHGRIMMSLSGLHLLLTYECNFECDHCFVFGSPRQRGTMTLETVREILDQAEDLGNIEWIYFEGGEPFLYYGALRTAVGLASGRGFKVGIVSNGYWATGMGDAMACLQPFVGQVQDLSISRDAYHWSDTYREHVANARIAAEELGIPVEYISIAEPEETHAEHSRGQIPEGESAVVFRGRAAQKLACKAHKRHWRELDSCPFEDLRTPERVHIDPLGNVHICQGVSLGNLFDRPLQDIFSRYDPDVHPVTGPLLRGGPAELARCHDLQIEGGYADECHLCFSTRSALRSSYPDILTPDQMYGVEKK